MGYSSSNYQYPEDDFTENDVFNSLDRAGLKWKDGHRYILSQCPLHDDRNPSTQIFKNDWFVNCLAGCGRFHITKAFPELKPWKPGKYTPAKVQRREKEPVKYEEFNLYGEWLQLPNIPRDHEFKGIPLEVLDGLGWRWTTGELDMGTGYFIPYFDAKKEDIPFAQVRHLTGDRRFTFLKDARPNIYGAWNLAQHKRIFVVEGASDCAVLQYVGIPWVGMPSASSAELIKELGLYANEMGIRLIYAGDNDEAGDKLKEALNEVAHYRVCQPPAPHKDWGDFFKADGYEKVSDYANKILCE